MSQRLPRVYPRRAHVTIELQHASPLIDPTTGRSFVPEVVTLKYSPKMGSIVVAGRRGHARSDGATRLGSRSSRDGGLPPWIETLWSNNRPAWAGRLEDPAPPSSS